MSDTRSQLEILKDQLIKVNPPNNARTTGQNVRDMFSAIVQALSNIADDKNTNNGYLGLDTNGIVDITKIKKLVSTGQFLKDNGTWATVAIGQTEANATISANTLDLSTYSGDVILDLQGSGSVTLNKLINFSNVTKLTLRPKSGMDLTVNDASVLPFIGIKLFAPTLVVYGTKFGFLELTKRNDGVQDQMFQTNFIDQYT